MHDLIANEYRLWKSDFKASFSGGAGQREIVHNSKSTRNEFHEFPRVAKGEIRYKNPIENVKREEWERQKLINSFVFPFHIQLQGKMEEVNRSSHGKPSTAKNEGERGREGGG